MLFLHDSRAPAVILTLSLAAAGAFAQPAPPTLRFRFEPGDEAVYSSRTSQTQTAIRGQPSRETAEIRLRCLARESRRALLLAEIHPQTTAPGASLRGLLLWVDEYGRIGLPPPMELRAGKFEAVFELLPGQPAELQSTARWTTPLDLFARSRRCALGGADAARNGDVRVDYTSEYPAQVGELLNRREAGRYWYSPAAGLVTRAESLSEDARLGRRRERVTILRQKSRRDPAWAGRRVAEVERWLQALAREDALLSEPAEDPHKIDTTVDRLARLWSSLAADFAAARSPFADLSQARHAEVPVLESVLRADAAYAARWLNKPAAQWSLPEGPGGTVTSEQVRRGPTLECLWSIDSPDAFATLAAVQSAAELLRPTPVQVVCLNMDQDSFTAARVIAAAGGQLRHVLGGPLQAVERVPRLPIVRVLDGRGVVRGIWIGWRPTYTAAVEQALRLAH